MNKLRILNVIEDTVVDGPGFRTAVYAAGCIHRCHGCHNPQSWNPGGGVPWSIDELLAVILPDEIGNVTFSGGDPLLQAEGFTELARRIKAESRKTIWCYTGYRFEEIIASPRLRKIIRHIDVLVDGRFDERLRDESLRFRGSANQRIIDVNKTLDAARICLWDEESPLFFPEISGSEMHRRQRSLP